MQLICNFNQFSFDHKIIMIDGENTNTTVLSVEADKLGEILAGMSSNCNKIHLFGNEIYAEKIIDDIKTNLALLNINNNIEIEVN